RSPNRAEDHRVHGLGFFHGGISDRDPVCVVAATPDQRLFGAEPVGAFFVEEIDDAFHLGQHFGADAVAGEKKKIMGSHKPYLAETCCGIAKASPQAWQPAIHGPTLSMGTNEEEPVLANARVVIIGAGFGGLEAAKTLKRAAADVIVIDRHNHHCFQPLLYQVATAALSPADIACPIRHILRPQRNATVLMEEVHGINLKKKCLHTQYGDVHYDYLVIATGASHSYFGHDEWSEYAPGLKRIEDATRIRRSILIAFERAEVMQNQDQHRRLLTFVIVVGGATGLSMAGAIEDVARQALAADFRRIDPRSARIILVEAGPRLLPTFPSSLSSYALRTLTRSGVEVQTGTLVTKCDANGVDLKDGRIDAGTVIWAAGVTASPAVRWLNAEADRAGRVKVGSDLSLPGYPEIFVIGDTAAVADS